MMIIMVSVAVCVAESPENRESSELGQLFQGHSYSLTSSDGQLSGRGVEFLLAETKSAQFVCIAEPHNVREIPIFVTSLFELLGQQRAFRFLAIEQGPLITSHIGRLAQTMSNDEIRKVVREQRKALHFRTIEEVEMIADVARLSEDSVPAVWGLDRVLAPKFLENYLARDAGQQDPEREFLVKRAAWSADNLAKYRADRNSQAARSADQHREDGFKDGFQHYYQLAKTNGQPDPRVVFRFGHVHMGRLAGRRYDCLGRYLNDFAKENGLRTFHLNIQLINKPGNYWSLTDYPEYTPLASVGDPDKWVLVNLRPARSPLQTGELQASDKLKEFVENYDAVLLMGGASRGRRL
jgi:hypothetical protein